MEKDKSKIPYLRIGTTYYKLSEKPMGGGEKTSVLLKWSRQAIVNDKSRKYADKVPKYDGFCTIPSHLNFQQTVAGYYNTYHELPFPPDERTEIKDSQIKHSLTFMEHIFEDQLELGLDYLKILFENPLQVHPILCLVSNERSTGKSTLLKWLKLIFGFNMTYIKGDTFGSQFNSDWADKLLVAIDEVFFDKREITERLKFLATTNRDKMEAKGMDRVEILFFVKFILCSNNVDNFIQIDQNETRFWVRRIRPLKSEDPDILNKLKKEIPAFLRYLLNRPYSTHRKTRMWFTPEQIRTKALENLVLNNNKLEIKMFELFYEFFETNEEATEIEVIPGDVTNMIKQMFPRNYWSPNDVRKILKKNWLLEPQKNGLSYTRQSYNVFTSGFDPSPAKGRFYTISKSFIHQNFVETLR